MVLCTLRQGSAGHVSANYMYLKSERNSMLQSCHLEVTGDRLSSWNEIINPTAPLSDVYAAMQWPLLLRIRTSAILE